MQQKVRDTNERAILIDAYEIVEESVAAEGHPGTDDMFHARTHSMG